MSNNALFVAFQTNKGNILLSTYVFRKEPVANSSSSTSHFLSLYWVSIGTKWLKVIYDLRCKLLQIVLKITVGIS